MTEPTAEPDNPAAYALARHIADHPLSTVQAAFRYLNAPLAIELHEDPTASAGVVPATDQAALRDRIADIRKRHAALAGRDWEAAPHAHPADGCRCLSCYDDPTGWQVDHSGARDCVERVATEANDFGRGRASCDAGPLLTYEEADALAHAAEDIGFLLDHGAAMLPAPADEHRLALSEALGLGTGAPWDAIHDRATELELPPLNRDPVARRLGLVVKHRATVLEEAADWFESDGRYVQQMFGHQAAAELRRMAAESAPADTAPRSGSDGPESASTPLAGASRRPERPNGPQNGAQDFGRFR